MKLSDCEILLVALGKVDMKDYPKRINNDNKMNRIKTVMETNYQATIMITPNDCLMTDEDFFR